MTFAAPSTQSESVKVADLAGHLLIITPTEYKVGIETVHGKAEAVEVEVIDLDTKQTHSSLLWFNVALRNALKNKIGQKVLARIGQGAAKPGKSAPWILVDATGDANSVALANAYLTSAPTPAPVAAPVTPQAATLAGTAGITSEVAALHAQLWSKPA